METMIDYVLRKLKDPQINIPAVANEIKTSKQNLYNIINNGDGRVSLIQALNDHFKRLGE